MEAASSDLPVLIILLTFVLMSNLLVFPSVGREQEAHQQNTQTGIAASFEIRAASNNSHGVLSSLTTTTTAVVANASSFCNRWGGVSCTDVD